MDNFKIEKRSEWAKINRAYLASIALETDLSFWDYVIGMGCVMILEEW